MVQESNPLVSIGMPVFNEENFITDAINSIINQSYQNFELIISDNASTDETQKICQKYALIDMRIHYYRNEVNIGSTENFNFVFNKSKGEFFVWVSGHDKRTKDFLSESIKALSSKIEAVLCYSDAYWLDNDGNNIGLIHHTFDCTDKDKKKRFKKVLIGVSKYASPIYGVYRSDALRKTALLKQLFAGDVLLLCELSLKGPFVYINKPLLEIRQLSDFGSTSSYLTKVFGKKVTKSEALKGYYLTIIKFFSLIDDKFNKRASRVYLKLATLYFFLWIQRYFLIMTILDKG